jgi:hypothetical protein
VKEVIKVKISERIEEHAKRFAEQISTNPKIPEKWKRKLLYINRGLAREVTRYHRALKTLEGPEKLSEKLNKRKLSKEEFDARIRRAKEQKKEAEIFFLEISKIFEQHGKELNFRQILLENERALEKALL